MMRWRLEVGLVFLNPLIWEATYGRPSYPYWMELSLSAHGGDLNGSVMLKGAQEKLAEVRREEAFIDLTIESELCLDGFGIVEGFAGEGVTSVFGRWAKAVSR